MTCLLAHFCTVSNFLPQYFMRLICFVCVGLVLTAGWYYRSYLRGPRNHMYRDYYTGLLDAYVS